MKINEDYAIKQINKFLKRHDVNQCAFARIIATTDRTVRRWVAGDVRPPGSVELLLEIFDNHPDVAKEIIRKYAA